MMRTRGAGLLLAVVCCLPTIGYAQDDPAPVPPEKFLKSPGGVDMRSGQLLYSHTDLAIGGEKGISLTRQSPPVDGSLGIGSFGGLAHNWDIRVHEKRISVAHANTVHQWDYQVSVSGLRSTTFRSWFDPQSDSFIESSNGGGYSWLDFTYVTINNYARPTRYTYRSTDGTRIEFRTTGSAFNTGGDGCGDWKCAYASSVVEPDGTTYTLAYDTSNGLVRLRSVTSNRGYALLFEYAGVGVNRISKACVLNLTQTAMPSIAAEQICPAGVPTSTYSYTSNALTSFVDQGGVSTNYGGTGLYFAGQSTPYATHTYSAGSIGTQTFADGQSYSYSWSYDGNSPISNVAGGSYTDNAGKTVTVQYGKYRAHSSDPTWYVTPNPEVVTDELGRTWNYRYGCNPGPGYCDIGLLQSITEPEGNRREFTYGELNNVTQTRVVAKAGSGLADIVTSSTYHGFCPLRINCHKPTSVTDAKGNTANYAYSSTHDGVLTATAPAANGIRPQTRYTYAQRYAWIKSGASYVQAASPVWVLVSEEFCRTSSAVNVSTSASGATGDCAAGASDEVVTTYDYGPNSGPNNLWLRGKAVTADGITLRTCYQYDGYGRVIAETSPNANLSSCS